MTKICLSRIESSAFKILSYAGPSVQKMMSEWNIVMYRHLMTTADIIAHCHGYIVGFSPSTARGSQQPLPAAMNIGGFRLAPSESNSVKGLVWIGSQKPIL